MSADQVEHPGDPRHPEHREYLFELGRATYAAARVAGIAFDIIRVFDGVPSAAMYNDPLGKLLRRARELQAQQPHPPGLSLFITQLARAINTRNDLIHALPVKDGLHRRTGTDLSYVRNFYTIDDLRLAAHELDVVWSLGSDLLYHDGGAAVRAWYSVGGG